MSERFANFRAQMPVAARWAYFDHAAVAPLPGPTRDALIAWAQEAASEGDMVWPRWSRRVEEARSLAAKLIGADRSEVALVRSTTEGINYVAGGFPWQPGDNVVTLDNEFPSNAYPWLNLERRGVETRRVATSGGRVELDALAAACDGRTRMVTISWVGYASGWRIDLDDACQLVHERGALLFVDAIQGLGVFPLDVSRTPVDFLAADGHKWLLGPEGAGMFYVRKQHLDLLEPMGLGWGSVAHAHDFSRIELKLKPSAARYEGGSQNMAGFIGLAASLELLLEVGIEQIGQRVLEITDYACRRLADAGAKILSHRTADERSGIVSFEVPGHDSQKLRDLLLARGVVLSCRAGKLRISPQAYVHEEDVERLVAVLGEAT